MEKAALQLVLSTAAVIQRWQITAALDISIRDAAFWGFKGNEASGREGILGARMFSMHEEPQLRSGRAQRVWRPH